jgi:ABC-2 type transport system ATP-binding protein
VSSAQARAQVGFLPEQPYFYQHLTTSELLRFYGEMFGLTRHQVARKVEELLEITGLTQFEHTRLSEFSKGMLQRIGLAQALVNDPQMVILDEPLSGLDPVGRREIRDLILQLKAQGKTIFLSSHILQDIEMICDRVAILSQGRVMKIATLAEVLEGSVTSVEIVTNGCPVSRVRQLGLSGVSKRGDKTVITLSPGADVNQAISKLIGCGVKISAVVPVRQTLEDYFMSQLTGKERAYKGPRLRVGEALQRAGGFK